MTKTILRINYTVQEHVLVVLGRTHVAVVLTSKFSEKVSVFLTTYGKIRTKCEFNISSKLKVLT